MLLQVENAGCLKSVDVKIDGLTVICGNNNTGKSTLGKILYCVCDALQNVDENIRNDKIHALLSYASCFIDVDTVIDFNAINKLSLSEIEAFFADKVSSTELRRISEKSSFISKTSANDVVANFILRRFNAEFGQLWRNASYIKLVHDNRAIEIHTDRKVEIEDFFRINNKVMYIDNPHIIDDLNDYQTSARNKYKHETELLDMVVKGNLGQTSCEEIIVTQKNKDILNILNSVSNGELLFEDGKFVYHQHGLKESISLQSVSTGIKLFTLIKKLLQDGLFESSGLVIFDEPEVYLHPAWQMKLAELIVLIQKIYGIDILFLTHNMAFSYAICRYAEMHGIEKACRYYSADLLNDSRYASIKEIGK